MTQQASNIGLVADFFHAALWLAAHVPRSVFYEMLQGNLSWQHAGIVLTDHADSSK